VAEFVENDAGENENYEKHAVTRRRNPSLLPGTDADPGKEEKEGKMHSYGRCAKAADCQRPRHEASSSSIAYGKLGREWADRMRYHWGKSDQDHGDPIKIYIYHSLMQMSRLRRAPLRAAPTVPRLTARHMHDLGPRWISIRIKLKS
jgi:hypothetical protein